MEDNDDEESTPGNSVVVPVRCEECIESLWDDVTLHGWYARLPAPSDCSAEPDIVSASLLAAPSFHRGSVGAGGLVDIKGPVALDGDFSSVSNVLVAGVPCGGGGGGGESASKSMTSGGSGRGVRTSCRTDNGAAAAAAFDGVRRPRFRVELRCTDTVPSARRSTRSVRDWPFTIRVLVLVETTAGGAPSSPCTKLEVDEKNEAECCPK
jgi:hypothetical protein